MGVKAEASFDEAAYLDANPDVRAAVARQELRSGYTHWKRFGRDEGRPLVPPPAPAPIRSRRDKLLAGIDIARATGVEIGPLTAPIVSKSEGNILYIDHADTETLHAKYANTSIDLALICPVDAVWGERALIDCLDGRMVDYVVNAHVIEHVPDLVTWLAEIHAILHSAGKLRMVIPDRRYTFDILRRESSLAQVLDAYIRKARAPLPIAILDHFLNVAEVEAKRVWDGEFTAKDARSIHSPAFALEVAQRFLNSDGYQDTHCWVFTPASFVDLCGRLAALDLLRFACERIDLTEPGDLEFVASLRPAIDHDDAVRSWRVAAEAFENCPSPLPEA